MSKDFIPLPNSLTGVERVRPKKAELYNLIADLHGLQIRDVFIARFIGVSRVHVRRILSELNLRERWSDPAQVFDHLPSQLRERCKCYNRNLKVDAQDKPMSYATGTAGLARPKET